MAKLCMTQLLSVEFLFLTRFCSSPSSFLPPKNTVPAVVRFLLFKIVLIQITQNYKGMSNCNKDKYTSHICMIKNNKLVEA